MYPAPQQQPLPTLAVTEPALAPTSPPPAIQAQAVVQAPQTPGPRYYFVLSSRACRTTHTARLSHLTGRDTRTAGHCCNCRPAHGQRSRLQEPKGNGLLPHLFVSHGDACKSIGMGEATWPEYFEALRVMAASPSLLANWSQHISKHDTELVRMALSWDWPTCRRWSEQVFKLISDGRLLLGWDDPGAIKDLQRDICTSSNRPATFSYSHQSHTVSQPQSFQSTPSFTQQFNSPVNPPPQLMRSDKDSDDKPCHQWNWGRDCDFTATHGALPAKFLHNCAWCAYRFKRLHAPHEQDCLKKKAF